MHRLGVFLLPQSALGAGLRELKSLLLRRQLLLECASLSSLALEERHVRGHLSELGLDLLHRHSLHALLGPEQDAGRLTLPPKKFDVQGLDVLEARFCQLRGLNDLLVLRSLLDATRDLCIGSTVDAQLAVLLHVLGVGGALDELVEEGLDDVAALALGVDLAPLHQARQTGSDSVVIAGQAHALLDHPARGVLEAHQSHRGLLAQVDAVQ
mmetsp:Transcript_56910/g.123717  ORF Transcript_56910/g.123717 Transcript_56910/m.123717 type:complete len:211 (-) Transcript_56910:1381-2013(-)